MRYIQIFCNCEKAWHDCTLCNHCLSQDNRLGSMTGLRPALEAGKRKLLVNLRE